MGGWAPRHLFVGPAFFAFAVLGGWPAPVRAQHVLVSGGGFEWSVAGYTTLLQGVEWLPTRNAPPSLGLPSRTFVHGGVGRVEWRWQLGDAVSAALDDRFDWFTSDEALPMGSAAGVGVSAVPQRSVDVQSTLYASPRARLTHDLDRAVVRVESGSFEIAAGRQAVAWGLALLFPVADWWAPLSPYELDPTTKRGVDALRARWTVGRADIEAIVADRGRLDDVGAGVLARFSLDWADLYAAVARSWNEIVTVAGGSAPAGHFSLRAEAMAVARTDGGLRWRLPRATVGFDWLPTLQWTFTVEAHFNGEGVASAADYARTFGDSPPHRRGEVYLLGRWYAGTVASWQTEDARLRVRAGALLNIADPSALALWSLAWEVSEGADIEFGGLDGLGPALEWPAGAVLPEVRSEFGAIGHLVYMRTTLWL